MRLKRSSKKLVVLLDFLRSAMEDQQTSALVQQIFADFFEQLVIVSVVDSNPEQHGSRNSRTPSAKLARERLPQNGSNPIGRIDHEANCPNRFRKTSRRQPARSRSPRCACT